MLRQERILFEFLQAYSELAKIVQNLCLTLYDSSRLNYRFWKHDQRFFELLQLFKTRIKLLDYFKTL